MIWVFSIFHGRRKDERERSVGASMKKNNCDWEDVAGEARVNRESELMIDTLYIS